MLVGRVVKMEVYFSSIDMQDDPRRWMFRLEDLGFAGWEIIDEGSQSVSGMLDEIKELHETTNLKLSLHAPFSDLNIASLNDRIWEESVRQIEESIERAYEYIEEICVIHPGIISPMAFKTPEKSRERSITAIKRISRCAKECGLSVAVENMGRIIPLLGQRPEELAAMLEAVGEDNVGICLDTGHANTTKTLEGFLRLKEKIIHMHANDNHGDEDEHLALGDGSIDWDNVFRSLAGYNGCVVVEVNSLEDGIKSLEFLRGVKL